MITNKIEKIISHDSGISHFSDHTLQILCRRSKGIQSNQNYIRLRSYKNFKPQEYRNNIINHELYIETLYEGETDKITENLQKIIQDSIEPLAPIKILQVSHKNLPKLSEKVRIAMAERDVAYLNLKDSKSVDEIREYKHMKNEVNRLIAKEKFEKTWEKLQNENEGINQKWKTLKKITGQTKNSTPQVIIEDKTHHTSHINMANALNRLYIRKIRKITQMMGESNLNPLDSYRKSVGQVESTFTFKKISMGDLRLILSRMKTSGSMGIDDISIRTIKQAQAELEPIILHLVNTTIQTMTFPTPLKTAKVVPVEKSNKDKSSSDGWRPVNVVAAISKIIERVYLKQILEHLSRNKLVGHSHHGALKFKSTQSLVTEVYDKLLEDFNNGIDTALITIDQSKAYEVVSHKILIEKMKIIGFLPQALQLMSSYLSERKQIVQLEGKRSESLVLGPQSVIQGSTLSCTLFLIYILDFPDIFHDSKHEPKTMSECVKTNAKTFVDDAYLLTRRKDDQTMKQAIMETMDRVEKYMKANRLSLNKDKTQIMLIMDDDFLKKNLEIVMSGKTIKHQRELTILGNTLSENLSWDNHVRKILIPALNNRVQTLRMMSRFMDNKFKLIYANAIFKSKLMFGIETWGGASKSMLNKIQNLQDQTTKLSYLLT